MQLILEEYSGGRIFGNELGDIRRVEQGGNDSLVVRVKPSLPTSEIVHVLARAIGRVQLSKPNQVLGRLEGGYFPSNPRLIDQSGHPVPHYGDSVAPNEDVDRVIKRYSESFWSEIRSLANEFREHRVQGDSLYRELDLKGPRIRASVVSLQQDGLVQRVESIGEIGEPAGSEQRSNPLSEDDDRLSQGRGVRTRK